MDLEILELSDYSIFVGDIWAEFHRFIEEKKYQKFFILVDENTEGLCFEPFREQFPTEKTHIVRTKSGELNKNLDTCQIIWNQLFEHGADRKSSLIINLAGGVMGDMGGFCASTFKRGFDFIQMPTTLLSQVDSSIGGKLGIDYAHVKNSIGVFANPKAVFIFPEFLKTLSEREVRSGFAEIIKHALIADKKQWLALQKMTDLTTPDWTKYLIPSLKIKQNIVKIDPFES